MVFRLEKKIGNYNISTHFIITFKYTTNFLETIKASTSNILYLG